MSEYPCPIRSAGDSGPPRIRRLDPRRDAIGHEFHQLRRVNAIFAPQAIQAHLKFWRIDPRRDAIAHECHQLRRIHVPFGPQAI